MNLSIPDAAVELGVSETRLRKTLNEIVVPARIELRRTRTGVRKTTVLSAGAIAQLRAHFEAPLSGFANEVEPLTSTDSLAEKADLCGEETEIRTDGLPDSHLAVSGEHTDERSTTDGPQDLLSSSPPQAVNSGALEGAHAPFIAGQTVPLAQFHALLYQHNVLREELKRVSDYLEGCDRLLGEMVRTIATLEERTRQLEPAAASGRRTGNPLTGVLRSVTASVQNAMFSRTRLAPPRPYSSPARSILPTC
jgi:hypothetical protein